MKKLFSILVFAVCLPGLASAASFTFDSNITHHSDAIRIGFTLDNDATGQTNLALIAGDYLLTITTDNNWAAGSLFSDGFIFGSQSQTPTFMADWALPTNHTDMSSYWRVNLNSVDSVADPNPVPTPAAIWLFGSALLGLAGFQARTRV